MNVGGWYVEPHRAYLPEDVDRAVALFPELQQIAREEPGTSDGENDRRE
jgi:hypothetical protein